MLVARGEGKYSSVREGLPIEGKAKGYMNRVREGGKEWIEREKIMRSEGDEKGLVRIKMGNREERGREIIRLKERE